MTADSSASTPGKPRKIFIAGCAGVPAAYGGFETLAENLVLYREQQGLDVDLAVFCSQHQLDDAAQAPASFHGAHLVYLPMSANGVSSIIYDICNLAIAVWRRADTVLLLGVSGAIALPLVRLLGRTRVVTNIDGIEWRRAKWGRLASLYLRFSEWLAVRCSHVVVADNQAVADYVQRNYGTPSEVIAYGGDHAVNVQAQPFPQTLPARYALALCRIEPENNIAMILEAFALQPPTLPLVFVGNWDASEFGRQLRTRFGGNPQLLLIDPLYDSGALKTLRAGASLYVHGHSAGGTNPSLVEAMQFGIPVLAFDCDFNRHTTRNRARYFKNMQELALQISHREDALVTASGAAMREIAQNEFTWDKVGAKYFRIL